MKSLIDAIYDHRVSVQRNVEVLRTMADAAYMLGMNELFNTLYAVTRELEESSKEVQNAHSIELNQRVSNAEASSKAMLEGVLTGIIIGKENRE